jgi:hypothetical protein
VPLLSVYIASYVFLRIVNRSAVYLILCLIVLRDVAFLSAGIVGYRLAAY